MCNGVASHLIFDVVDLIMNYPSGTVLPCQSNIHRKSNEERPYCCVMHMMETDHNALQMK